MTLFRRRPIQFLLR